MENSFNTAQNVGYVDGVAYTDHNQWRSAMASKGYGTTEVPGGSQGATSASTGYPTFNFDWEAADREALAKLAPYYQQKLDQAGGDVERAKQLLEEDYQTGTRLTAQKKEQSDRFAQQDYNSSAQQQNLQNEQDTRDTRGALNQKGVLVGQISPDQQSTGNSAAPVSDYAQQWHLNPLNEQQKLRKQAIDRALQRQQEIAQNEQTNQNQQMATTKQRGIEEQDIQLPRYQQALEQEKQDKAINQMAPMAYQQEYTKYKALNNIPG